MPLSTGTKTLDNMMGGGIPLGVPSLVFGKSNLGKTWMCFQLACMSTRDPKKGGLGKPALYLDTEFFFTDEVFDLFYGYFRKRWPDLSEKPMIEIVRIPDIFELGKFFNIHYTIKQEGDRVSVVSKFPTDRQAVLKEHGKSEMKETVQSGDWLKSSDVWTKFEKNKYGIMVIDSITVPIKSVIASATQNFPARTSILTQLLGTLYPIAKNFNTSIVVTDHITSNPMSPGYAYGSGDPWGGQNVTYYIKNQFGLFPPLKEQREKYVLDGNRIRRVERHRMPGKDQTLVAVILQKDYGYADLPDSGAQPAETSSEAS